MTAGRNVGISRVREKEGEREGGRERESERGEGEKDANPDYSAISGDLKKLVFGKWSILQ